jgi:hypothetical protein
MIAVALTEQVNMSKSKNIVWTCILFPDSHDRGSTLISVETFIPLEWKKGLRRRSENRPSPAFIGTRALLSAINHQIHG